MSLSKSDRATVDQLAKRIAMLIDAMTEARCRLTVVPQTRLAELHEEIMEGDHNRIEVPEVKDLDATVQKLEESVRELWRRNSARDAVEMLKVADAAASYLSDYVNYNYPHLAKTVRIRVADFHEADFRERLEKAGIILPDGRVVIGNEVSLDPIPPYKPRGENPNYFQPPEAALSHRKPIAFDKFECLNGNDLFDSLFFIKDPDNTQNLTAFKIEGRKDVRNGTIYELLWEGSYSVMEVESEDLKDLATGGLWTAPNA